MNYPKPATHDELVTILSAVHMSVDAKDSFEGFVQYTMPTDEIVPDDTYALVKARFRVGNSMGQGGLSTYGRMHPPPMVEHDAIAVTGKVPDYTAPDEPLAKAEDGDPA